MNYDDDGGENVVMTTQIQLQSPLEEEDVIAIENGLTFDTTQEAELRRFIEEMSKITDGDKLMALVEQLPKTTSATGQGRLCQRIFSFMKMMYNNNPFF